MSIEKIINQKIITREEYIKTLKWHLNSQVIKVLTWMRRVWKSFMLKSLIKELLNDNLIIKKNIFYINKEDLEFDDIKDYKDLDNSFNIFLKKIDKNKTIFVWIDEIQEIKWWEKFINSVLSVYNNKIEIFITWSNSNMLSSDLSTLIAWRYIEFEIFPLSLKEYSLFSKKEITKNLFLEYLKYWWLPWIFFMNKDDLIIFNYLKSAYNTILIKDIIKYFWLRNIDFFEKLYKYILSNIWSIFSAKNISDYLKSQRIKISTETVLNYINYWLKVYVLNIVKAVEPETKKYFEIYNKYYIWDLWLRNALVWYNFARDIWKLIENYVFLELKRHWYEIKIWRLKSWKEIDFIAEKNWIKKYFQVCYLLWGEDTIKREYSSLKEISDNWEKYIVSFDDIDFWINEWIKHIHIMNLEDVL